MFKYNNGRDIPLLMNKLGMKNDKEGIAEFAATLGYTEVYVRDLIKDNRPLKKPVKWALWGIERYVSEVSV